MKAFKCLAPILLLAISIPAAGGDLFDVKPVAAGLWAAIAKPYRPENCNSAIIELKDSVLVVDTASTPSAGRALIAEIKKLTAKPVRYVVNTHFHWDHYWGNEAFVEAFPGVEIISTETTRLDMKRMGIGNAQLARWKIEIPQYIEKWKAALPKSTDPAERAKLQDRVTKWGEAVEEFKTMRPVLPNVTFERRMLLGQGDSRVEILWLGRGHTPGDAVVYVPSRHVVASGDLLAGDTPYIGTVTPQEWVETLDELGKLDFDFVIPGHGDVMKGKDGLELWKQYLTDVAGESLKAFESGESLEEAQKNVTAILKSRYAAKFPDGFQYAVEGNVTTAYHMISGE